MFRKLIFAIMLFSLVGCEIYYKEANKKAVEKLNNQIRQENYDEIYGQSSEILRRTISKDEFITRMKAITEKMKKIDDSLTWQTDEKALFDKSLSHAENFSYRIVSKNGKKAGIQIVWNEYFKLCGLSVIVDEDENGNFFRYCD